MPIIPRKSSTRAWHPERKPFEGITGRTGFYSNAAWRRFRLRFLQMNPLCEQCQLHNAVTPATEVHHIQSVNPDDPYNTQHGRYGEPLDAANCMALCKPCHDSTTSKRNKR